MKKNLLTAALFLLLTVPIWACSNLLVGKKASVDGSTMVSYAADSHSLYGELYHWPAMKWPQGAMLDVYEWDTGKYMGKIPQIAETYNVIGNMNEHQLAITETTWGGREELSGSGMIDYGSLIYIALQRSKTAREAIKTMTGLVEEFGYASEGESFSIVDKDEVWILEMIGKGKKDKGAVWVAIRIPDDCISAHANQARIQNIPFSDKENCFYSKDVVSFAKEMGYFKGKDKDFSFQKAYNPYTFSGLRGCEARVWSFFKKYGAVDMDQYTELILGDVTKEPMPLYVKPKNKVSVADVRNMMRDHYEGTALDMTTDIGAGPYKVPIRWRPMSWEVDGKQYVHERAISTQQTGFVLVAQMRDYLPDAVGGILWFGVDDADMTVFRPLYASMIKVPESLKHGNGSMSQFSWTSAFWIHNWVANMAYNKYDHMIVDIRKVQSELENSYDTMTKAIENVALEMYKENAAEAIKLLTTYSVDAADNATVRWKQLGEFLLVKYIDGNIKKEENGVFKLTDTGIVDSLIFGGYNEEYYRQIVKETGDRYLVK